MHKELSKLIKEWKDEAGVKSIILIGAYPTARHKLKICTDRPGLMIGFHGKLINKYKNKIQEKFPNIEEIEFIETDKWFIK